MDQHLFVGLVRKIVVDDAAGDTLAQIAMPSGRSVSEDEKRRAAWLKGLPADERANVEYAVVKAAKAVAFGLFCVLDGVRAIEDSPGRGHLELRYIDGGANTLLASSAATMPTLPLHELF